MTHPRPEPVRCERCGHAVEAERVCHLGERRYCYVCALVLAKPVTPPKGEIEGPL